MMPITRGEMKMKPRTWIITCIAGLLSVFLIGGTTSVAQAQMCSMGDRGAQGGPSLPSSGQQSMMSRGMMGQGMCSMCMMQPSQAGTGAVSDPMGMMGRMPMQDDPQMDAKTRGQMLQMRGEMLKAMGEVMLKHSQMLSQQQ